MNASFEEIDRRRTPIGEISVRRRLEPALRIDVYEVKVGRRVLDVEPLHGGRDPTRQARPRRATGHCERGCWRRAGSGEAFACLRLASLHRCRSRSTQVLYAHAGRLAGTGKNSDIGVGRFADPWPTPRVRSLGIGNARATTVEPSRAEPSRGGAVGGRRNLCLCRRIVATRPGAGRCDGNSFDRHLRRLAHHRATVAAPITMAGTPNHAAEMATAPATIKACAAQHPTTATRPNGASPNPGEEGRFDERRVLPSTALGSVSLRMHSGPGFRPPGCGGRRRTEWNSGSPVMFPETVAGVSAPRRYRPRTRRTPRPTLAGPAPSPV